MFRLKSKRETRISKYLWSFKITLSASSSKFSASDPRFYPLLVRRVSEALKEYASENWDQWREDVKKELHELNKKK